jgi:hypothetical protein
MKQQRCLLCGQEYPTGLNVMGCLLCFPCEQKLLAQATLSISRRKRHQLLRLYGMQGTKAVNR